MSDDQITLAEIDKLAERLACTHNPYQLWATLADAAQEQWRRVVREVMLWRDGMSFDHIPSPACWCNPAQDDSEADVWIHNYQPTQHAARQGEDAGR